MIDPAHLQPLAATWRETLGWSAAQTQHATELLTTIAAANGGAVAADHEIAAELTADHTRRCALDALERYAKRAAQRLAADRPARLVRLPLETPPPGPGLAPATWVPALNINAANSAELEALPAIGPVLARRILQRRATAGRLAGFHDLDAIEGVGDKALETLQNRIVFGEDTAPPLRTPALDAFLAAPDFNTYIALIAAVGGAFVLGATADPRSHALDVLAEVAAEVSAAPYPGHAGLPGPRASAVHTAAEARDTAAALQAQAAEDATGAAVLFGRRYGEFVLALVEAAAARIDLALFFLLHVTDRPYPTNTLVEALIAAHQRGVAVRVVLDQDHPGDPYHSRQINAAAFAALQAAGVPVRFDSKHRLMHAKVLIVDGARLVIGSHNWTAGSLRQYHEISSYVASASAATRATDWFEALWGELE